MIINVDPDRTVVEVRGQTCLFHQTFPFATRENCPCSVAYVSRPATESEYRERRRERLTREVAELRGQLRRKTADLRVLESER